VKQPGDRTRFTIDILTPSGRGVSMDFSVVMNSDRTMTIKGEPVWETNAPLTAEEVEHATAMLVDLSQEQAAWWAYE